MSSGRRFASHENGSTSSNYPSTRLAPTSFRSLVWQGSVPICVHLDESELVGNSDRLTDCYYLQAPRTSYLPLLLADIRRHLVDLVLNDAQQATLKPDQFWLDCNGEPLRWHWPIGLIFDFFLGHSIVSSSAAASQEPLPLLSLTLHLSNPPTDKLALNSSIDTCRTRFMNMVKESDYVRWGNTRRVTSLRKVDQDALWEGVVQGDFDRYWSVATKLMPQPAGAPAPLALERTSSQLSQASGPSSGFNTPSDISKDPSGLRGLPVRLLLADLQAPVLQDVVAPLSSDGTPTILYSVLSAQIPLLFPPRPQDLTASFVSSKPLAKAIMHGIVLPLDAEVSFLAATMAGADGWLQIVIKANEAPRK